MKCWSVCSLVNISQQVEEMASEKKASPFAGRSFTPGEIYDVKKEELLKCKFRRHFLKLCYYIYLPVTAQFPKKQQCHIFNIIPHHSLQVLCNYNAVEAIYWRTNNYFFLFYLHEILVADQWENWSIIIAEIINLLLISEDTIYLTVSFVLRNLSSEICRAEKMVIFFWGGRIRT